MAICPDCEQEMQQADSCNYNAIIINGVEYERSREHFGEPNGRCHDCGIKHGETHHFGCDVERCPKCGLQLIGCYCLPNNIAILVKRPSSPRRRFRIIKP